MAQNNNQTTDYTEIGEQIFNLVNNDKDKVSSFYSALSTDDKNVKPMLKQWFANNVKQNELKDLFKKGQTETGLYSWLTSDQAFHFFHKGEYDQHIITADNVDVLKQKTTKELTSNHTKIHQDIEDEDENILTGRESDIKKDMSDGEYKSNYVDDEDEIEMALDIMDGSEDDEADVDIVFSIVDDGSEDDEDNDGSDDEEDEIVDDIIHKRKIQLDHHINKVVESIDDEEEIDRYVHKKYYVMKKKELGTTEKMNKLEDELDKENISYYDFGKNDTIAIKIYESNEVKVNRILEKLEFKCRCADIAHYTDNWYS